MHLWVHTMLVQLVRGQGKAGVEWKSHRTRGGGGRFRGTYHFNSSCSVYIIDSPLRYQSDKSFIQNE